VSIMTSSGAGAATENLTNSKAAADIKRSIDGVQKWVEDHNYRAYEPFDGMSTWARPLAFGNLFCERLLMQAIRQSPINLRPLLGVTPKDSTKGRGYMAAGYILLYRATGNPEYLQKATACLEWLDGHKVARFKNHSWSNHFDFVSRGGSYTSDDPIIVWTALIGQAYLDAYEVTKREWFLSIAESACRWVLELPRETTSKGVCISYLPDRLSSIHNSNMLGAALLARTAKHNHNAEYLQVAREGMVYSCTRQLEDGAWQYAEDPKFHWIDNFHTGYNLDSLLCYMEASGDKEFRPNFDKGLEYYKANFFEESGRPKYYNNRTFPVDSQCIAQSIDSLATFADIDPSCLPLSQKVAYWAINNMQDKDGHFYYRQYPMMKAKTPMLHWAQATTFKGLCQLFLKLNGSKL
jgi:hypothetical protein